jgi:N-formylglutamate amidohydrolase
VIGSVLKNDFKRTLIAVNRAFYSSTGAARTALLPVRMRVSVFLPECSVNLTYHSVNKRVMCHYCGYSEKAGDLCRSAAAF